MKKISHKKIAEAATKTAEANNKKEIIVNYQNDRFEFKLLDGPTNNLSKIEV